MAERFHVMRLPDGRSSKLQPEVRSGKKIGAGSETAVFRASLWYERFDKVVEGLVYKKFHYSKDDRRYGELTLEDTLRKWQYLRKVKEKLPPDKNGFNMPGTIRGYHDNDGAGVVMTDLSEGGKYHVVDLKDLHVGMITKHSYQKIRDAILRDIDIALKNNIDLPGTSPFPLDPWAVVLRGHDVEIFLSDIGNHVSIYQHARNQEVNKDMLLRHKNDAVRALDKLSHDLFDRK